MVDGCVVGSAVIWQRHNWGGAALPLAGGSSSRVVIASYLWAKSKQRGDPQRGDLNLHFLKVLYIACVPRPNITFVGQGK